MADALQELLERLDRAVREHNWTYIAVTIDNLSEPVASLAFAHVERRMPPGALMTPYQRYVDRRELIVERLAQNKPLVSINGSAPFSVETFRFVPTHVHLGRGTAWQMYNHVREIPEEIGEHFFAVFPMSDSNAPFLTRVGRISWDSGIMTNSFLVFLTEHGTLGQHVKYIPELHRRTYVVDFSKVNNKLYGMSKKERVQRSRELQKAYVRSLKEKHTRRRRR